MSDNKKSHPGLSKAPAPITPLRGTSFTPYGIITIQPPKLPPEPDWKFWLHMPEVKLWQAVALSMNIDPDSLKNHPQAWMSGNGSLIFKEGSFSSAQGEVFYKRLRLLVANKKVKSGFSPGTLSMETPHNHGVRLSECFAWALSIGWDLPPVLIAIGRKQAEMTGAPAPKIDNTPEKPEDEPVITSAPTAKIGTNKKKWDDARLRALWEESIMPGVTQASLAKKHGVKRQRIAILINTAKGKFSTRASSNQKNPWGQIIK